MEIFKDIPTFYTDDYKKYIADSNYEVNLSNHTDDYYTSIVTIVSLQCPYTIIRLQPEAFTFCIKKLLKMDLLKYKNSQYYINGKYKIIFTYSVSGVELDDPKLIEIMNDIDINIHDYQKTGTVWADEIYILNYVKEADYITITNNYVGNPCMIDINKVLENYDKHTWRNIPHVIVSQLDNYGIKWRMKNGRLYI